MSWLTAIVGPELFVKEDFKNVKKSTEEVVKDKKVVIIYFSAHWCVPCKKFTPFLGVLYEEMKDRNACEVIFASADSDMDGFDEYYAEMPWPAIPFDADAREAALDTFKIKKFPTVLVFDGATGKILSEDGRPLITEKKTLEGIF